MRTRRFGAICFHPSLRFLGNIAPWHLRRPWSFYLSPNCTPWASTLLLGDSYTRMEKIGAIRRWALWGHGYDCEEHDPQKESEFFEMYMIDRSGDEEHCGCCGERLTVREAAYSNVCIPCLVKEMARYVEEAEDDGPVDLKLKGGIPWGKVTM